MMFKDFLKQRMPIKSQASYVEYGFGQVEPNHLSAQRTGQIYAQLPANPNIKVLNELPLFKNFDIVRIRFLKNFKLAGSQHFCHMRLFYFFL